MSYFNFVPTRFQWRQDTAANWTANNPTPLPGEPCLETDTGMWKIGDGVTAWNSLGYAPGPLANPGADRLLFWDASAGKYRFLALGAGLSISDTTLDASGGSGLDASTSVYRCWDFMDGVPTPSTATGTSFITSNPGPVIYASGAGTAGALLAPEAGHPGILRLSTGTTATGYSRVFFSAGPRYVVGGGEQRFRSGFRIPTLSTPTQRFAVTFGLTSIIGGTGGKFLTAIYRDDVNSGCWQLVSIDGSGTTTGNSTIAPVAGAFTALELKINAAGTSVDLLVDGVLAATVAANIPTDGLAFGLWMTKNVGTTSMDLDVDYGEYISTLATPR